MKELLPHTGFRGVVHHWKDDLSAAISVALVALPLALGISLASGAPPMSGVLASIIGGIVTTIFRGSHVAINGPAAGLIVVVLGGVESLADESGSGFKYVLAAIVVSGAIQMLMGLLKMGKLGDMFPSSVINGMLATIGVIIFAKQFHVALGTTMGKGSALNAVLEIPHSILNLNPWITGISILSMIVLALHGKIKQKFLHSIPAPLQVMVVAVVAVFLINLLSSPDNEILGEPLYISEAYLISIPAELMDNIIFPDFSKMWTGPFWLVVISITLVASIETLISTKAVDKLDHYKRRTNLNKDLFAVGLSTTVSGLLGGLPIITVIVRSSVNVNHNAKTRWSNFYHGIILLVLVVLAPWLIREIPQAALATILVFTGFKLASPRVFRDTLLKGWEQFLIFLITLVSALAFDLLWGIIIGIAATLLIHWFRSGLHYRTFLKHLVHAEINVVEESKEIVHVDIKGIANFAILLKLINKLKDLGNEKNFIVNFSRTKLIDSTVLEFIHEHKEKYFTKTHFEFVGLDVHETSSSHPLSLHVLERPMQRRMTTRQNEISHYASASNLEFKPGIDWNIHYFEGFNLFEFHLLEYQRNRLRGDFNNGIKWQISDLTYNDGVFIAAEHDHITLMILILERDLPAFDLKKEDIRKLKSFVRNKNAPDKLPKGFQELAGFLNENASYYIEGLGNRIIIYRKNRLLSPREIIGLYEYVRELVNYIPDTIGKINQLKSYLK